MCTVGIEDMQALSFHLPSSETSVDAAGVVGCYTTGGGSRQIRMNYIEDLDQVVWGF